MTTLTSLRCRVAQTTHRHQLPHLWRNLVKTRCKANKIFQNSNYLQQRLQSCSNYNDCVLNRTQILVSTDGSNITLDFSCKYLHPYSSLLFRISSPLHGHAGEGDIPHINGNNTHSSVFDNSPSNNSTMVGDR